MLYSMTAYAEQETHESWGSLYFEIKSVNHRYLELSFKLPDWLRDLEGPLRDIARRHLSRGKVDCALKFLEIPGQSKSLDIDLSLAQHLIDLSQSVQALLPEMAPVSSIEILKWPNVVKTPELKSASVREAVLAAFQKTLDELLKNRALEGEALANIIQERLQKMQLLLDTIRNRFPLVLTAYKERLLTKLKALSLQLNEERIEQEIVYTAVKLDIEEELDRFETHLKATEDVVEKGGSVGRKLDFLMQELNREANTLGSKSIDSDVTQAAIELKVLIEQVREQIQNLV